VPLTMFAFGIGTALLSLATAEPLPHAAGAPIAPRSARCRSLRS
jgi:hypothetical protein